MTCLRIPLPIDRRSLVHEFRLGEEHGRLTVGFYDDGRPGEVFLRFGPQGSTESGFCDVWGRAFSLLLQYGVPLPELAHKFRGFDFEPQGFTDHPTIHRASSVVDYAVRFLELRFVQPELPLGESP